ncbi:sodium:solute symporter [Rhodohalobacter barkolensis]|uniref:Sodium:solute symporter n=1 Tax=Rhodohalobacter barkolensis TaxID=2053187 RepID=A0A2N0VFU4_9BACT|nr:sodium:solute symporter [Rhodohalobacter barkolensis]PKD43040.1 sodium:solute symporter [Rhodohalobacter barkolensis]
MGFTLLDGVIIVLYLVAVAVFGIWSAGTQKSSTDYFLGGREMPWWAILFSVVATETSTLTFISIPAVAYGGNLLFLQLTLGYILGRIIVAIWFLPAYVKGEMTTAYQFLEKRFGSGMRKAASSTFIVTRLLADGVRLFATAIPLAIIFRFAGVFDAWGDGAIYLLAISVIAFITLIYTFLGGIKAVIWMDVVQMVVYIGGALFALILMLGKIDTSFMESLSILSSEGKLTLFNFGGGLSIQEFLADPYVFWVAVFGGAVFSIASHGTDQLIVQRLLATGDLRSSQKALIWSGFVAAAQFAFFLLIGLMLYIFYSGAGLGELGLRTTDEIFAKFIVDHMPVGVAGLIIASLFAAAMSSLSSSLNALASSTTYDIIKPLYGQEWDQEQELWISRLTTIAWGIILTGSAFLFTWLQLSGDEQPAIVELGLGIASYTYGGLLGIFMLGRLFNKPDKTDAMIGFFTGLISLLFMVEGALQQFLPGEPLTIAWPLYTLVGGVIVIAVANASFYLRKWVRN